MTYNSLRELRERAYLKGVFPMAMTGFICPPGMF
jgi:hypothetical protein